MKDLGPLSPDKLAMLADKHSSLGRAKEILLNGLELALPNGHLFFDKEGHGRETIRMRWWLDFRGKTYREAILPDSKSAPLLPISLEQMPSSHRPYAADAPPVFNGHYWLPPDGNPVPQASNIAILDYSVAKEGMLVAYRWDGEASLDAYKFVFVSNPAVNDQKVANHPVAPSASSGYRVMVDDNFHYMDEDERWTLGEFATYEEALAMAKKMVEDFFPETSAGEPEEELYSGYTSFGDDPWIVPFGDAPVPPSHFSAWDYAREVSRRLSQAAPR